MREKNKRFLLYTKQFKERMGKVSSLESFLPFFMEFIEPALGSSPVTRSSFLLNKQSSPMASGLCLEIADLKHSDDTAKSKFFLDDDNWASFIDDS